METIPDLFGCRGQSYEANSEISLHQKWIQQAGF